MHAVASMSTTNIKDLSDLTDATKLEYCERYGYLWANLGDSDIIIKTTPFSNFMDFNKPLFIKKLFEQNPKIDWLLMTEADSTITNLTITIDDKIDNDYHIIMPVDRLNLNSGNWLLRNSPEGRDYIQTMIDRTPEYAESQGPDSKQKDRWGIQQYIIDTLDEFEHLIKIVPQRHMNSYEQLYDYCVIGTDILGTPALWEPGDWIVHWPGLVHQARIEHATKNLASMITR
jgi:hypothetical protein